MAGALNDDDDVMGDINVTPFVDIVLVLLIIFMVTTSVIDSQSKNIDLPGAEVSDKTPSGVTVTVTMEGQMLINDEPTSEARLYADLEAALSEAREKLVILRGDRQVLLGQAVNILDVAQQAGARGIALATKSKGPADKPPARSNALSAGASSQPGQAADEQHKLGYQQSNAVKGLDTAGQGQRKLNGGAQLGAQMDLPVARP